VESVGRIRHFDFESRLDNSRMVGYSELIVGPCGYVLISRITGHLKYRDFTCPVTALIRWDEKAGLQRDAIRSR
jgi:hypothetical protein